MDVNWKSPVFRLFTNWTPGRWSVISIRRPGRSVGSKHSSHMEEAP